MDGVKLVLQPLVHVGELAATAAMLEALGGKVIQGSGDGDWAQISIGGAEIGLLAHPPNPDQGEGDIELNFQSETPVDVVEEQARAAGVEVAAVSTTTGFGRQLILRTPDGLLIKINEIDPEKLG